MTRRRLTREDLAVETCCYVCDPTNASGLHIDYSLDEEEGRVHARYTPCEAHEGAPGVIHGGVLGAILDDATAWAVNTLSGSFGLTRRAQIEYSRMVRAGHDYDVSAWVDEADGKHATAAAELRDAKGRVCCATRAEFSLISHEEAQALFGRRQHTDAGEGDAGEGEGAG